MIFKWFRKNKKQNKKISDDKQIVKCMNCGYTANMSEFLSLDTTDTICPKCGEKNEHIYYM